MKGFVASVVVGLVAVLTVVTPASAFEQWQIKMSEPKVTQQIRTFNIEYTALSISADDQITISLKQDGTIIGTQTTTKAYGDSGVFTVTVPTDGKYTYLLEAVNSAYEEIKISSPVTVSVATPANTIVTVVQPNTDGTAGQTGGTMAGANTQQGNVGEDGASTENKRGDKDVLGAKNNQDSNNWSNVAITVAIIVALVAGYIFFYGEDKAAALIAKIFKR